MTTIHNPSQFEPSDYEVLDYLDNKRPQYFGQGIEAWQHEIKWWEEDMLRTFGADWIKKIHHCIHCGNSNVRWITAVRHLPTEDVVVFGSDCTDRLGFANKHAFKLALLQKKAEGIRGRLKVWKMRTTYLEQRPDIATAIEQAKEPVHANNHFVHDVLSKLDKYGSLSDKQAAAVITSLAKDHEFAARRAAQAAEVKGDAPEGRVEVTGEVLSVKEQESIYGFTQKMLIKLANNSKVWLTVPSGSDIERGMTVTVRATFTRSRDDKSFAFGSRPHLVRVTPAPAAEAKSA